MDVELMRVGAEGVPVAVLDGFAADPDALRAAAAAAAFGPARHLYPGLRAELPAGYWPAQAPLIAAVLRRLGMTGEPVLIDASFAVVTTPRAALAVAQRLPHCDAHEAGRAAFVHYLDPGEASGGTAFYRHRSTRFETVGHERAPVYQGQLEAELRLRGAPAADYPGEGDRLFERIATVAARYNRAVVYPSQLLHSGVIPPDAPLGGEPAAGRLTVTGFLRLG